MKNELDAICSTIRDLLSSTKEGLKYSDIIERMKNRGSRATINKHLRDLESKEYVVCKLVRTDKGRSTVYKWNTTPSKIISYKPPYALLSVKIGLEVLESPMAMVHHTMGCTFRNQSEDVQEYFGMHIFGDVPRRWKELNPHIYEKDGNKSIELDPSNIFVGDDSLRKSISVKFNSPLYPTKQKTIELEYDWEEPNQFWEYRKADNPPDFFECELLFQTNRNYQLYVYENDQVTQAKKLSRNEPQAGYRDGKKFVRWYIENFQLGQVFRFEWREP